jgi:hypothetical protein
MANNSRKPISPELEKFLADFTPEVAALALQLRQMILELVPDVLEQIDEPASLLSYGYANTYKNTICVLIPQNDRVNFGFPKGTELSDPAKLLEGTGKKARHVKVRTEEQAKSKPLRELLLASIEATPRP